MTLPRTSRIVAIVVAIVTPSLAIAQSEAHWTGPQTTAASGAAIATVGLLGFLIEHLRRETPSRWVGVMTLIPPEVSAIVLLGIAFAWWNESALRVSGYVVALLTPIGALVGVTIAQAKVTSPETLHDELVATAHEVSIAKAAEPETHAR